MPYIACCLLSIQQRAMGVHAHFRNSSTGRVCENLPVAEAFWLGVFQNPWDVLRAFCAAMVSQTGTTCTGMCSSVVQCEFHVPSLSSTFSHHAFVFCGHPLWEAPALHYRVAFCGRPWPLPANFTMTDIAIFLFSLGARTGNTDQSMPNAMASTHSPHLSWMHKQNRQHSWDPMCSSCSPQTCRVLTMKQGVLSCLDANGRQRGPITSDGGRRAAK